MKRLRRRLAAALRLLAARVDPDPTVYLELDLRRSPDAD